MASANKTKLNAVYKSNLLERRLQEAERASIELHRKCSKVQHDLASRNTYIRVLQQERAELQDGNKFLTRLLWIILLLNVGGALLEVFL